MGKTTKRMKAILREWKVWLVVLVVGAALGAYLYARIYPIVAPQPEQTQYAVQTLLQRGLHARERGGRACERLSGLLDCRQGDRLQPRLP